MGLFARPFHPSQEHGRGKPRGFLPDGVSQDAFVLVKACSRIRLTYEIRLATFLARESSRRLRLMVQASTAISTELRAFAIQYGISIEQSKT